MDERVRTAFDGIRAEEGLKEQTRAYLSRRTRGYTARPAPSPGRLAAAAACLLLLLTGAGWWTYLLPTSTISIDINPSLELGINRFDRVVSVTGYNDDGRALADSLELRFLPLDSALDQVLSSQAVADCLAQDAPLSIAVVGSDQVQTQRLLTQAQACAAGHGGGHCYTMSQAEAEDAHHLGLSYGKYSLYLALQALDPSISPAQVQQMTMAQLRDLLERLSAQAGGNEGRLPAQGGGSGESTTPSSGHHGEGQGHHGHGSWDD